MCDIYGCVWLFSCYFAVGPSRYRYVYLYSSFYVCSSVASLFPVSILHVIVFYLSLVIFLCDSCLYQIHRVGEQKSARLAFSILLCIDLIDYWSRLAWPSQFTVHLPHRLPEFVGTGLLRFIVHRPHQLT